MRISIAVLGLPKPVDEFSESIILECCGRGLVDLIREFLVNVDEIVEPAMPHEHVGLVGNAPHSVLEGHADHIRESL